MPRFLIAYDFKEKKKAPEKQWTRKTAIETCIAHQQNEVMGLSNREAEVKHL